MAATSAAPRSLLAPCRWLSLPDVRTWGATAEERTLSLPCDRHLPLFDDALYRGIRVDAEAAVVFRWLCQLRVAPYSYDWIDNGGRQSPRALVPGLERLAVGQRVMRIFELVEFETGRHLTLLSGPSVAGRYAATYLVVPQGPSQCRLLVKIVAAYPPALRPFLRRVFPAADWLMMQRQLLTLKELAEATPQVRGA